MAEKLSDTEKHTLEDNEVEHSIDASQDERITAFSSKEQNAIICRVDKRLVLTLGFLYLISLMDRTNLGAAAIAG
jgi:hypothetical protein